MNLAPEADEEIKAYASRTESLEIEFDFEREILTIAPRGNDIFL